MKKLIIFASLIVVVVSAIGIRDIMFKSKVSVPNDETVAEEIKIDEELSVEEVEIAPNEETIKQEVVSGEVEKIPETKETTTTKTVTSSQKQETISSSVPKTEVKPVEIVPPKVEEPKVEEPKVEQDPEYLRLLAQVEYATYEEAMKVGFAIAEKDTVNIASFSCPYIVYKGEILGYRLEIRYY